MVDHSKCVQIFEYLSAKVLLNKALTFGISKYLLSHQTYEHLTNLPFSPSVDGPDGGGLRG